MLFKCYLKFFPYENFTLFFQKEKQKSNNLIIPGFHLYERFL